MNKEEQKTLLPWDFCLDILSYGVWSKSKLNFVLKKMSDQAISTRKCFNLWPPRIFYRDQKLFILATCVISSVQLLIQPCIWVVRQYPAPMKTWHYNRKCGFFHGLIGGRKKMREMDQKTANVGFPLSLCLFWLLLSSLALAFVSKREILSFWPAGLWASFLAGPACGLHACISILYIF